MLVCTPGSVAAFTQFSPEVSQALPCKPSVTAGEPTYSPPTSKLKLKWRPLRGSIFPNPTRIDGAALGKVKLPFPVIGFVGSLSYCVPFSVKVLQPGTEAFAVTLFPL